MLKMDHRSTATLESPPANPGPAPSGSPARALRFPRGAVLAGITLLAAGLRFGLLGKNSLWFDEAWVARLTQLRWTEMLSLLASTDVHPPLYFFLMKGWTTVAGTSEVALRLPSALASVSAVLLTYFLIRRIASEPVSRLAAFLVAVSPFDVMAGQEARMYPLLELLALGSTLALVVAVEWGGAVRWAAYAGLAAATAYTHYLGILILAAHGIWIAGFESRHLRAWLLAAGGVVLLCAPWLPSMWHQATQTEYHSWYRERVTLSHLTGLLGLFAFGGSLFGMQDYFFSGTLPPAVQALVVLPFLAVLWRGGVALSSDRRALGLLGLCLAFPIGAAFLISLMKPMFYPRWFSFLIPFYATFIALGIVEVAGRFRAPRAAVAGLAAGMLALSVPVFGRYYFDPSFRPYQWRAAAAVVRAEAQPADAIIYVYYASEVAFRYYFHEQHPTLILTPLEATSGAAHPGLTAAQARDLAARYPRVWLIATIPFDARMEQRLFPTLKTAFRFGEVRDFRAVWVALLEAKP